MLIPGCILSILALILEMDGRYYGGTNKVQSDEGDAPVTEVYQPPCIRPRARKTTPDDYACKERSDGRPIQQDN